MDKFLFFAALYLLVGCKQQQKETAIAHVSPEKVVLEYAKGFSIQKLENGITEIRITSPWPGAESAFTYALVPKGKMTNGAFGKGTLKSKASESDTNAYDFDESKYDAIVPVPVERVIVTSTTHIPALEALGEIDKLVGFPQTEFVSSEKARKSIDGGQIQELGNNETINTEMVIALRPDVVVGFGVDSRNKAYNTLEKSAIPVVYNGDWTETTPLGKAEWIKFFAPFFQKEAMADSIFDSIASSYNKAKDLAKKATSKPTVLVGGLYKDVWHIAGGQSWMAQFLKDAQADYLWSNDEETGGVALSLESVLDKAVHADFWLNPSMITSYEDLRQANRHYRQFDAYGTRKIFSNTISKGPTGGLLYYELAPQRPDVVLKDLIHIFHPRLLPDHEPVFFKPLMADEK